MRVAGGALLLAALAGCGREAPAANQEAPPPAAAAPAPPDSLALVTPAGIEVWFIVGREGRDSAGVPCYERGLEIRDAEGRRRVPLLYTLEAPVVVDDTSVRARVYLGCRPGDAYQVSLRTGRPVPVAP